MVGILVRITCDGGSVVKESTPRINNKVVSDSKRRINHADHRFWNRTDKSVNLLYSVYL
jgi:hypothetical protein